MFADATGRLLFYVLSGGIRSVQSVQLGHRHMKDAVVVNYFSVKNLLL
jgi:hypothetical protein